MGHARKHHGYSDAEWASHVRIHFPPFFAGKAFFLKEFSVSLQI